MNAMDQVSRRILVIDDNRAIHEDFRKILERTVDASAICEARAELFKDSGSREKFDGFMVECADQGQSGYAMVQQALREGRSYSVAFVDMRMPPGWDGIETIEHLWQVDPELYIVICTAYSDHAWDQVIKRVAQHDKLLILRKPFDAIEVWQLANSLAKRWHQDRQMKTQLDLMVQLAEQRAEELQRETEQIQQQLDSPEVHTRGGLEEDRSGHIAEA